MKRFIIQLLLFVAIFFILDKCFLFFVYQSPKKEVDTRLESVIEGKINKDIIILGSSLAARDILAKNMEDSLKVSTYNLGYPGSNIEFHEFMLRTLLKFDRHPELVILTVDNMMLLSNRSLQFRIDRLYPLVKYEYIRDEFINRGEKNSLLEKSLVLYRLDQGNYDLSKRHFIGEDSIFANGSMSLSFQRRDREFIRDDSTQYNKENEQTYLVNAFTNFINECHANNIKLLLVFPPLFNNHKALLEQRIRELADNKANIYVYDQSNPVYKNKNYFYDENHLQLKGAAIFTDELSNYIQKNIKWE